jgi:hypothetical protein
MREWGDHERSDSDESKTGKKRVKRSEKFRGIRFQRINRAHSAKNHRCVEQRIDPAQITDKVISENADCQRDGDDDQREQSMASNAPQKFRATQERMGLVLVHKVRLLRLLLKYSDLIRSDGVRIDAKDFLKLLEHFVFFPGGLQ